MDLALGKFLKLPADETHLLTAGMDFNRKANLLRALVSRQQPPNQSAIQTALKTMQNESMRNVFAHSFLRSVGDGICFIERARHGNYVAREHNFTIEEFIDHVQKITTASVTFYEALNISTEEFQEFCLAALSAKTNS